MQDDLHTPVLRSQQGHDQLDTPWLMPSDLDLTCEARYSSCEPTGMREHIEAIKAFLRSMGATEGMAWHGMACSSGISVV